jgi:hypothetical protein
MRGEPTTAAEAIARKWRKLTTGGKVAVISVAVLAACGVGAAALSLYNVIDDRLSRVLGRWIVDFILIFLPGAIFALFIFTRSNSLLNSFIANLDRLGLLGWRVTGDGSIDFVMAASAKAVAPNGRVECDESRRRRISSYFDRFQATYGEVRPDVIDAVIAAKPKQSEAPAHAMASSGLLKTYLIPVYGVTVLCAVGWLASLPPLAVDSFPTVLDSFVPRLTAVSAAFLGAYFFSLQLLVWRFMRRDLGPNAYVAFTQRVVLAVIAAWMLPIVMELSSIGIVSEGNNESWILLFAFVIGVFPAILWQFITGAVKKFPGVSVALPNLEKVLPLSDLDGLTVWHEARLEEEDVENAHNMATADVVDLMLSTRFPPHRIIEWIDQAILLSCIAGDDNTITTLRRNGLRKYGITNATSVLLSLSQKHISDDVEFDLGNGAKVELMPWLNVLADGIRTHCNLTLVRTWKNIDGARVAAPTDPQREVRRVATSGDGAAPILVDGGRQRELEPDLVPQPARSETSAGWVKSPDGTFE